jgi:alkanesulfonate monooxygenase SsuD/methylene tetrahydromethanopterin reductase-like flavin-dependent oxidoreductase (luciferase family)
VAVVVPPLHLGLELAPLTPPGPSDRPGQAVESLTRVAEAIEAAGFDSLWLGGDPGALDACTAAGALAATGSLRLGVLEVVGAGRDPSILARDLTALDVLSGGRASVLFSTTEPFFERARESVQVCRLLFTTEHPSFEGASFTLRDAANLPPPVQSDGPPILLGVSSDTDPGVLADYLAGETGVEGVVFEDDPAGIDAYRAAVHRSAEGHVRFFWRGRVSAANGGWEVLADQLSQAQVDGAILAVADVHLDEEGLAEFVGPWRERR